MEEIDSIPATHAFQHILIQDRTQSGLIDSCFTAAYLRKPFGHQTPRTQSGAR